MRHDPHPWSASLASLQAQVWTGLVRGVHDRRAPARHPVLATVTADGRPRARTVVLRQVEKDTASLDLYTDANSAKVAELRCRPFAALHVWDSTAHLQVRLEAEVTILAGTDAAEIWARVPAPARSSYGIVPSPGTEIETALNYAVTADPAAFAVLRLKVLSIDTLHLGQPHRRARFERSDGWQGRWLAP